MRRFLKSLAMLLVLSNAGGCYTIHYFSATGQADASKGKSHSQLVNTLFWGLLTLGDVSLDQCGTVGIYRMQSRIGPIGAVASVLTGGIWMPFTVKVVCADPKGAALGVDETVGGWAMAASPRGEYRDEGSTDVVVDAGSLSPFAPVPSNDALVFLPESEWSAE